MAGWETPRYSRASAMCSAFRSCPSLHFDSSPRGVAFAPAVFVGANASEVSSCAIHPEIRPGRRVRKGEEVGYFQYGGSTYCLIFRPGAIAGFTPESLPQAENPEPPLVLLGTHIATAN
jgi:hypothetical protein